MEVRLHAAPRPDPLLIHGMVPGALGSQLDQCTLIYMDNNHWQCVLHTP